MPAAELGRYEAGGSHGTWSSATCPCCGWGHWGHSTMYSGAWAWAPHWLHPGTRAASKPPLKAAGSLRPWAPHPALQAGSCAQGRAGGWRGLGTATWVRSG